MSHMAREPESPPGLHVVQIRYQGSERAEPEVTRPTPMRHPALTSGLVKRRRRAGVSGRQRDEEPTVNLGLIGEIAEAVAAGRRAGKPVLVVGGNCAVVPGVVGGLQEAHGPAAKVVSSGSTLTAISIPLAPLPPVCSAGCRSRSRPVWPTPLA